jgi:hypothetical protein
MAQQQQSTSATRKQANSEVTRTPNLAEQTGQQNAESINTFSELASDRLTPAQVLQLQGTVGNSAVQRLLAKRAARGVGDSAAIQRQFQPVTTTKNAHLRVDGAWDDFVGPRIDEGDEIVVDPLQQRTQVRRVRKNVTWTKAVGVTGAGWIWALHNGGNTYIRNTAVGQAKQYPHKASMDYKPPHRRSIDTPQYNWHHLTGEFVEIEDSVSTPGAKIAWHKGTYKRITPATGQVAALDADEERQINTETLEAYLLTRLEQAVRAGLGGVAWENLLVTTPNLKKIMYANNPEGSKALRFDDFGKSLTGARFVAYYKWVMAADGPFQRIQDGAAYVRNSLEHWRAYFNPPNGDNVTITSISVNGSDLHEHGLGVLFVKFNKPAGGPAEYTAAGEHEVVVKPEERSLEQGLFGTQADSLANYINTAVGLAGPDQITTYKQKVDAGFGTLCEKVVQTRAKDLPTNLVRPITQALKESLMFVLITGLTDLHGENVLWDAATGKPYMIDADNALKLQYMTPGQATAQNGYLAYNNQAGTVLNEVYNGAVGYETALLRALQNPTSFEQILLLDKVKDVFAASVGRTVPIETAVWGNRLKVFIMTPNVGQPADAPVQGVEPNTKWQWCNYWAATVPTGAGANAPGLQGEVGVRNGTNGNFLPGVEAAQLFADFKVGQIPFYNYEYGTGYVKHNGQTVWHGQPIGERMQGLFALFPNQIEL